MHIELGILNAAKLTAANTGAAVTLSAHALSFVKKPGLLIKTGLAAVFFSGFMQAFHMPVGASELHFIGASAVYLLFGFLPALFGFALGLLLQAMLFEPADMLHLGVNILSLGLPLIAAHAILGRRFFSSQDQTEIKWATIVRFDAIYYAGVIAMVGFWLSLGSEPTPFLNWAMFAIAYVPLVFLEPAFTYYALRLARRFSGEDILGSLTMIRTLKIR